MNDVIEVKLELWQVDVLRGVLGELLDGDDHRASCAGGLLNN